jgi:hypothetical protein
MLYSRLVRPLGIAALALAASAIFEPYVPASGLAPSEILDTAIARMGGDATLRRIERVRFEMLTSWYRLAFDERPSVQVVGYEMHSDLRNYSLQAWRNTRKFLNGTGAPPQVIDVVRDTAAIRQLSLPNGTLAPWLPLNIAYVDERDEVFAFAPERLLLAARAASDLQARADTVVGGVPHARVTATIEGFATTILISRKDGFLAMARYRAAHPNDFGLAPWGDMQVDIWYSNWSRHVLPGTATITYPGQWDVRRVGRPYKRVAILSADFNAGAPADSFAISDSLRAAYVATARRPMWDVPMDSARIIDGRFAMLGRPGQTQAAVKLGNQWLFLEGALAPGRNETDARWLTGAAQGSTIAGSIMTVSNSGRGGAAWLAGRNLPLYVAPGGEDAVRATLANWKQSQSTVRVMSRARWLTIGGDSLWVETIDYPDGPGALVAYLPSARWVYSGMATSPQNVDLLMARVRARGWTVEHYGSLRGVSIPAPGRTASR